MVYLLGADGVLHALDAGSGDERWQYTVGQVVASSPSVAGGVVYVSNAAGAVFAIDATTGTARWRRTICTGKANSPSVLGNLVYVPCDGASSMRSIYALDAATGNHLWHVPGSTVEAPNLAAGLLFASNLAPTLFAYDATTGAGRWETQMPGSVLQIVVTADAVLVGARGTGVVALDAATGAEWYRIEIDANPVGIAVGDGVLIVATAGALVAYGE
jgi:outer membrane protein assembly factor BamB